MQMQRPELPIVRTLRRIAAHLMEHPGVIVAVGMEEESPPELRSVVLVIEFVDDLRQREKALEDLDLVAVRDQVRAAHPDWFFVDVDWVRTGRLLYIWMKPRSRKLNWLKRQEWKRRPRKRPS
jgi:hypothetical protein